MPATAAMDNETLDHLLSVVDDSGNLRGFRELSKPGHVGISGRANAPQPINSLVVERVFVLVKQRGEDCMEGTMPCH